MSGPERLAQARIVFAGTPEFAATILRALALPRPAPYWRSTPRRTGRLAGDSKCAKVPSRPRRVSTD